LVLGAGGATLYTHAATGPTVYAVYEANVKDTAAYEAALPEVGKLRKRRWASYMVGAVNFSSLKDPHKMGTSEAY
jgi:hypothetical protein